MLSDISTEMLVKLRERYLNGRMCFSASADGGNPEKRGKLLPMTLRG